VTASEPQRPSARPILEEALDLFVYAPVGLLSSSLEDLKPEDLPELAERGRGRIRRLLSNARVVGNLTITMGRRTIDSELRRWRPPAHPEGTSPLEPDRAPPASVPELTGGPRRNGPAPELAIPDYEALSASQVVKRLNGLGPDELEAVYRHESTTRRRRTILHRVLQLLGREGPPGPGAPAP
jgi:hypothetical protein